jgi:acetyl-CoA carboxylase biotin carboxyl carrier protein
MTDEEACAMELHFDHNGTEVMFSAESGAGGWRVSLPNEAVYDIVLGAQDDERVELRVEQSETGDRQRSERVLHVPYVRLNETIVIAWKGQTYRFTRAINGPEGPLGANRGQSDSGSVTAPTGGVVADVFVTEGQIVEAFQQIAVIEAMKVMTPVEAPCAGRIEKLFITRGERIEQDAPVAEIEAHEIESSGSGAME